MGSPAEHDYYELLGVSPSADSADIKKAFFALAKKHHPDVNPDDKRNESHFKLLTEAYSVLSSPGSRAEYDAEWRFVFGYSGTHAGGTPHSFRSSHAAFSRRAGTRIRPEDSHVDSNFFDADAWNRAHYGPTDADRARNLFQEAADAERRGWSGQWENPNRDFRQNYERRRMAQASASAMRAASKAQASAAQAGRTGFFGPVLLLGGIAVGLLVFDQITRRMRSHDFAKHVEEAKKGSAIKR